MHRRQLLKLLTVGAGGALVAGGSLWRSGADARAFFLVTADPHADLARLRRLAGLGDLSDWHVSTTPIAPASQDLSLMLGGTLADPLRHPEVPPRLADLAAAMRSRPGKGYELLTVERARPTGDDAVVFTHDGVVQEHISLQKNYAHIEMPGHLGPTTFRLQDGRLSVISSSCRHELCKKMGGQASGKIICAPNRLVATLPSAPGGLDAVIG